MLPAGLGTAAAAEQAAEATLVRGTAWAQLPNQAQRELEKGSALFVGDELSTDARAVLKFRFGDGTTALLGSASRMTVTGYSAEAERESLVAEVSAGAFRFVTGAIGRKRPEAVVVKMSVATIGIRGTDFAGEATPTSARVVLMEPEDETRPTAIEVYNDFGRVVIDQPGYGTEVPDPYSPPSPPRRMRLNTVTNLMRSLQSIQRIQVPRRIR